MTANKLHKILTAMIEKGHGRSKVCIDKDTFTHAMEQDGCVILEVDQAMPRWVPVLDEIAGGIAFRKDGSERGFSSVVLVGDNYEPPTS